MEFRDDTWAGMRAVVFNLLLGRQAVKMTDHDVFVDFRYVDYDGVVRHCNKAMEFISEPTHYKCVVCRLSIPIVNLLQIMKETEDEDDPAAN